MTPRDAVLLVAAALATALLVVGGARAVIATVIPAEIGMTTLVRP